MADQGEPESFFLYDPNCLSDLFVLDLRAGSDVKVEFFGFGFESPKARLQLGRRHWPARQQVSPIVLDEEMNTFGFGFSGRYSGGCYECQEQLDEFPAEW